MEFLLNDYFNNFESASFIKSLTDSKSNDSDDRYNLTNSGIITTTDIERFIDTNPTCKEFMEKLSPKNKKYTITIFRLYFEHFLAKNWGEYSLIPFTVYCKQLNETLKQNNNILPYKVRRIATKVVRYNLIEKLDTINGLTNYIIQVKKLNTYNTFVAESVGDLVNHYSLFNELFHSFMLEMNEKGLIKNNSKRVLVLAS